jgi:hypothetical protein
MTGESRAVRPGSHATGASDSTGLRRIRKLPLGRWHGSQLYDRGDRIRILSPELDRWYRADTLGLACDHQGPTCPVWRQRRSA